MKQPSSTLLLPISIVLAGLLIGIFASGAIIYVNRSGSQSATALGTVTKPVVQEISYLPISSEDYIRGSIDAKVKLVDYSDLECPYCKRHHATLQALVEKFDGNELAWVYRHFPIPALHAQALPEAIASECVAKQAGQEGFWSFVDTVYEVTTSNDGLDLSLIPEYATEAGVTDLQAFQSCYENEETRALVEAEMADAANAKGSGTPYGVLTSERKINNSTRTAIFKVLQSLGAPELVVFSEDRSAVGLSGALPLETFESVVTILIDYNR